MRVFVEKINKGMSMNREEKRGRVREGMRGKEREEQGWEREGRNLRTEFRDVATFNS